MFSRQIIEPLGGLRLAVLMLGRMNHLEQQIQGDGANCLGQRKTSLRFQIQFLIDQASDLTREIIFTKPAVDPQPFRRLAGPGRFGELRTHSLPAELGPLAAAREQGRALGCGKKGPKHTSVVGHQQQLAHSEKPPCSKDRDLAERRKKPSLDCQKP